MQKKKYPPHITTLNAVTRAEICRPGVAAQQTFRFIASAAAPLGLRLIAGWIKPQWLTDELQHWGDMGEMNVEQFKVKLALSTLNSSKEECARTKHFGVYLAKNVIFSSWEAFATPGDLWISQVSRVLFWLCSHLETMKTSLKMSDIYRVLCCVHAF